jgi:hypothetical protein
MAVLARRHHPDALQAQLLIPMAVSLGYGIIFGTFITLMLVPVSYAILEDLKALGAGLFKRQREDAGQDLEQAA